MEAFARPAWRVVAYFAMSCKRSSLLAFGVFVDGGGARRNASAARASAASAASIAYVYLCARCAARAPLRDALCAESESVGRRATRCAVAAVRDGSAAASDVP